jgi:hypothetical protein
MSTQEAQMRLQELHVAFGDLTLTTAGLSMVAPSPLLGSDTPAFFTMSLVGMGSPEVQLRVGMHAADLTARSGSDHQRAGRAEIRDSLGVELETCFAWDDSVCSSAGELAGLLLKHMRRRLKAVAEVTPEK